MNEKQTLEEEIKQLKNKLEEEKQIKNYWMNKYNELRKYYSVHTNPEDTYRDDFGGH